VARRWVTSNLRRAQAFVRKRAALELSARDWRAFLAGLDKAERRRPKLELPFLGVLAFPALFSA